MSRVESLYDAINERTKRDLHPYPLHALIDDICDQNPDSIAVLCGDQSQTYRQLQQKSDRLANHLRRSGVGPGDLVGLCCNRDIDLAALLVGILKSGAGYVPLDPDYPADRLLYMVQNSGIKHTVTHQDQNHLTDQFETQTTVIDPGWSNVAEASTTLAKTPVDPASIAYVIYTSGSTGKPKGVRVPHAAAVNFLCAMVEWPGFTKDDRLMATTTLSFDISVLEMFLPLIAGGSISVVDRQTAKDATALYATIEKHDVNFMQATPAMWRMIIETDFVGRPDMKFVSAGEPLPLDLVRPLLDRCGELWNLYGPTETTVYSTGKKIVSDEGPVLIGVPIANTQIYIVDEDDALCPPGKHGELLIAGDGVTLGYLGRPELNAKAFVQWNGTKVYRTGDLACLTESGEIHHLGRMDNQIKLNGHRIELDEIDAAMAKQTGVRQAATVLREDRPGDLRLVGYVLTDTSASVDLSAVRENVAKLLPDYMVPERIVTIDEFPLTPSGKLDRKSFPAPSTERPDISADYVAPVSDNEKQLASIWCDVLQLDRVGVRDNFLDLGGNSIRAVTMVARAQDSMGLTITPGEFFDNPTIESVLGLGDRKRALQEKVKVAKGRHDAGANSYAIVGMAARMPGAENLDRFWSNLVEGRESIRFFTPEELDATLDPADTASTNYVPARGVIDDADHFDARFFKMPPRFAELTDPQQRILMELSWSALEDAGIIPSKTDETIGIWAGSYSSTYFTKNILTNPDLVREVGEFNAGVYNEKDYIATRVAHALNLKGPAINVNTACSTALVALIEACKSLRLGDCDVALAGGASVTFPQNSGHLHQEGSIFSPDGHCRPFDANAAGTLFSDGAGLVVVKRLQDAVSNGDRIYAVVKGYGLNNDGGDKASFSAPSIDGQASAIAMAQSMSGIEPDSISYVEAHGTATPIGDPIEVAALSTVFEAKTNKKQYCAIGSVKSNVGHTVAAAGIAGLIKVAMSMHRDQIPATLHFKTPNPQIPFDDSPFYVCDQLLSWQRGDEPRRAAVSAFGVGGTNAHVILEDPPQTESSKESNELPVAIFPVSGVTEQALDGNADQLALNLADRHEDIHDVAMTLQSGREEFSHRAIVVADSLQEAAHCFHKKTPPKFIKRKSSAAPRDVVFMFPGQGAQYVRMGQNLYEHSNVFRGSLDECAEILNPLLQRDLRQVLFPRQGDEDASQEILRNTQFTQPALFALGFSLAKVWTAWGINPSALIGHSIGEFAAACTSGVFSLDAGLQMIAERGRAMQALPRGSMMSVRLPGSEVEPLLSGDLAIGSFNGPNLCVVSGPDEQVAELQSQLESREIACRHLHTSHAFHSPMMDEIVEPFATFIAKFDLSPPRIPILSTVTGDWMSDEQATDPNYWANHLRAPVRFSDAVQRVWHTEHGDPSRILLELGPRKTLATLSKQHAADPKQQLAIPTLSDNADDNNEWRAMLTAVGQLWLSGSKIDWTLLSSNGRPRHKHLHVSLPTYAFQRKRYFIPPGNPIRANSTVPNIEANATLDETTTQPQSEISNNLTIKEPKTMTRIPNIVETIEQVFENTSGFDLQEFDGETTFFEMGLDSLVLTQTAAALTKELKTDVTFRQLLEQTVTVNSLAEWLDEQLPIEAFQPTETPEMNVVVEAASGSTQASEVSASNETPVDKTRDASAIAPLTAHTQVSPQTTAMPLEQTGGSLENIVQMQLHAQMQLMQHQLQLLGGQSVATGPQPKTSPPATQPTESTTAATKGNTVPIVAKTPTASNSPLTKASSTQAEDAPPSPAAKRFSTVKLNDGELSETQQKALDEIIKMNESMMPRSKAYAQQHRQYMADPRTVSGFRPNMKEMTHPIVVERSKGVHLWDIDGNEYIDFTCGFGSNILGHAHEITVKAITQQVQTDYAIGPQSPLAGEVAKLFCELTGHERMAFSNTGSEAVLGCTRLARNATGRDLIVMFNGDYHGILDEVIVRGSKKRKSFPSATGIPKEHVGNTLILDYGTDESLEIIRENMDQLAAVLVEPVQSRKPELQPREFLTKLGKMTAKEPTALIFDEVISGFRIGLGGAQEHFGVKADLASYGKIVGGGMPIGVVAGKPKYMDGLDGGFWNYGDESRPESGMTYFAGTFVRHPLTLAASKAILTHLRDGGQPIYDQLNRLGDYLASELNETFNRLDAPLFLANFGSLFKIQFHEELVYSEVFFAGLRRRGMHIWDHRPCLLTFAHQQEHVDALVGAVRDTIIECQRHGFMPGEGYKSFQTACDPARPPQKGARIGRDEHGQPGWFVPDTMNPGQYVQVGFTV